jgi:hypothetical protein
VRCAEGSLLRGVGVGVDVVAGGEVEEEEEEEEDAERNEIEMELKDDGEGSMVGTILPIVSEGLHITLQESCLCVEKKQGNDVVANEMK